MPNVLAKWYFGKKTRHSPNAHEKKNKMPSLSVIYNALFVDISMKLTTHAENIPQFYLFFESRKSLKKPPFKVHTLLPLCSQLFEKWCIPYTKRMFFMFGVTPTSENIA